MPSMFVHDEVSKPERSRDVRLEQPSNMQAISVADEVSKEERSSEASALQL